MYEKDMSEKFDSNYFQQIWGTAHRHDYCETLANQLIQKYGKIRFLDIGTGCGFLIKTLNEKGCDAWGLEISDYALANTCVSGRVLKGSVVNIPYKDHSFDVVYSQGLWEYVGEEDIPRAWSECNRVGKHQEHNYDTEENDNLPEHQKVTIRSRAWWKEKLQLPRVLVACPIHELKGYSFQRWIDNVKSLTYPNYDILVVDNTEHEVFYNRWKDKVPMIHDPSTEHPNVRIADSMEVIRKHFLAGNYTYWMNIESDVIPPKDVIEKMMHYGKDADWVGHGYPSRDGEGYMVGIGCALFNRKIMEENDLRHAPYTNSPDGFFWEKIWHQGYKYKTMELYYYFPVDHLAT